MTDFKIRRGLSSVLFPYPNEPARPNDKLVIEDGCWYLCTDTAELFLGGKFNDSEKSSLKRINGNGITSAEINSDGDLVIYYSNGESAILGHVVGKDGTDGKDGLTVSVKIGDIVYTTDSGIIELPSFATQSYVDEKIKTVDKDLSGYATETFVRDAIAQAELGDSGIDLNDYAKKEDLDEFVTELYVDEKIIQTLKTITFYGGDANPDDDNN